MEVKPAPTMEDDTDESDYDSEEDEGEGRNPWGTRTTKERIRRRGIIPLNLTNGYGKRSGWGVREGIRELLQNFADNVRENEDGTPREVDWVYESSDEGRTESYIAYAQGTRPRPDPKTKLHNRAKALGYIIYRQAHRRFILVNKDTCLSRRVWSMGETSKGGSEHHIGGHGEGMKVGIIALLRHLAQVTYYTNKEIWDWGFHNFQDPEGQISKMLAIKLAPYQPNKAKLDLTITGDTRAARKMAKKDTTVIVQGWRDLNIRFNDYLFLVNPPAETLLETKLGTILTGDDYRFKIFVKGIFVEKRDDQNPPILAYGVNFSKAALDRDRRSLITESQAAKTLCGMWNDLIERSQGSSAEKYLELLLQDKDTLETLEASGYIKKTSAGKIFEQLKSKYSPETFFYNSTDKNVAETIRIIKDCLQRTPKSIPGRLYEILLKYALITTAEEERLHLFSDAPVAIHPLSNPWVEHTLHAFDSALLIHPRLKASTKVFRHAPPTVEIDVIRTKDPTDGNIHFQLHHRWLDFDQAHQYRRSCPLWQDRRNSTADKNAVCDCAVEELFDLVVNEIEEFSGAGRKKLMNLCRDLLHSMPKHTSAVSREVEPGTIETEIRWDTSSSKYFNTSFDVLVYDREHGSIAEAEHRFHDPPQQPSDDKPSSAISPRMSENGSEKSSAESSPEAPRVDLNFPIKADYLWRERAEKARSITIKCPHSTLSPGKKYVALIRPTEERQSFFSAPFEFEIQCPAPQNIQVKKVDSEIRVAWDFPYSDINVDFRVICESVYDTHHRSLLLTEHQYSFKLDLDLLAEGLEVTVEAKSKDGVRSLRSIPVKVPPEELYTTSPSEESEDEFYDDEGFRDSDDRLRPSPSVQSTRGFSVKSPSINNIREHITVQPSRIATKSAPMRRKSISDRGTARSSPNPPTRAQVDMEEELNSGFADTSQQEGEQQMYADGQNPMNTQSSVEVDSADMPGFGKIEPGNDYLCQYNNDQHSVGAVKLHRILRIDGNIYLVCGLFYFIGEATQHLVRGYLDRDIDMMVPLPINQTLLRITQRCTIDVVLSGNSTPPVGRDGSEHSFVAEWGLGYEPWEVRKLRNRDGNVEVDWGDLNRLTTPLRVHNYNCGIGGFTSGFNEAGLNVVLGTGTNPLAFETWKSNHLDPGRSAIKEDLDVFLEKYADRVQNSLLEPPSVVIISNFSNSNGNATCCESVKLLCKVFTVIDAPIVLTHINPCNTEYRCARTLVLAAMDCGYEMRQTKFQAEDYGAVDHQSRDFLLASKIGLPILPRKEVETKFEKELRSYGFNPGYKVCGSTEYEQLQLVREEVRPPLARAIADSISSHVHKLRGGLEDQGRMQDSAVGSRKRKAESDSPEVPSKKACL